MVTPSSTTSTNDIGSGLPHQSGTIMSTRLGDFDPRVFPVIMEKIGLPAGEVSEMMVTQGGCWGFPASAQYGGLDVGAAAGAERAELALEVFCYQDFSSVSLTVEPARTATVEAVKPSRESGALISLDPNLRLSLLTEESLAREAIRKAVGQPDVAKLNEHSSKERIEG
ncbi:hypothetical protein [Acididesulfobacillus acetoxydans]